jgi:hypothetical protein
VSRVCVRGRHSWLIPAPSEAVAAAAAVETYVREFSLPLALCAILKGGVVVVFLYLPNTASAKSTEHWHIVFGSKANHALTQYLCMRECRVHGKKKTAAAAAASPLFMSLSLSLSAFYAVLLPFETSFSCPFV